MGTGACSAATLEPRSAEINVKPQITITITEDYATELEERLRDLDISNKQLARQMGVHPSQVSRWFRKNEKKVVPTIETVQKIEAAIIAIRLERRKQRQRAKE